MVYMWRCPEQKHGSHKSLRLACPNRRLLFSPFSLNMFWWHYDSSFPGAGDVWFSLRNTTYQNNSIVILENIGEGGDALLCMTNLTTCCRPSDGSENVRRNWFFPNETRVPSSGLQWDFHRGRGQMVVRMQRRRGGAEGVYRCEIPDTFGFIQNIYIGVYSANTGELLMYSFSCEKFVCDFNNV